MNLKIYQYHMSTNFINKYLNNFIILKKMKYQPDSKLSLHFIVDFKAKKKFNPDSLNIIQNHLSNEIL